MVRELAQITLDEAFVVPIAEPAAASTGPVVMRTRVKNVTWDDWGWFAFQDIWLDR
jgi:hypothetical protein